MSRKNIIVALVCTAAVAICSLVLMMSLGVSNSLKAENTLHAYYLVMEVVEKYALDHNGEWPHSWEELKTVEVADNAVWKWPEDQGEIAKRIQIDFSLTSENVVGMTPQSFTGIQQVGPSYTLDEGRIATLIRTIQQANLGSD